MTEGAAEACISCICKRVCRDTRIRCCDDANAIGLGMQATSSTSTFRIYYFIFCDANGWVVGRIIMASAEWMFAFPTSWLKRGSSMDAAAMLCKMRPSRLAPVGGPSYSVLALVLAQDTVFGLPIATRRDD
jgi:hypothetical protein